MKASTSVTRFLFSFSGRLCITRLLFIEYDCNASILSSSDCTFEFNLKIVPSHSFTCSLRTLFSLCKVFMSIFVSRVSAFKIQRISFTLSSRVETFSSRVGLPLCGDSCSMISFRFGKDMLKSSFSTFSGISLVNSQDLNCWPLIFHLSSFSLAQYPSKLSVQ